MSHHLKRRALLEAERISVLDPPHKIGSLPKPWHLATSSNRPRASPGMTRRAQCAILPARQHTGGRPMKQPNRIKAAMRAGRKAFGYGLTFPSTWVIDILGKLD